MTVFVLVFCQKKCWRPLGELVLLSTLWNAEACRLHRLLSKIVLTTTCSIARLLKLSFGQGSPLKTEQSFVNVIGLFDVNRRELNMSEVNSQTTNRAIQITHYMRVWSWLRMNAGGVPNTCKSNEVLLIEFFGTTSLKPSGGRVSNTWVTCP